MPFAATWTDLETVILRNKSDRERQIIIYSLHVESKKKKIQMNLFIKHKQTHRLRE